VIVRDLFTEDSGGYVADLLLLEKLAHAKLETAADRVRDEGWKWVEISLDHPSDAEFGRVYPREVELTEAENARLDELENELDAINAEIEKAEEPDASLTAKAETLESEYRAIEARSRVYNPEDLAHAGAFAFIGCNGNLEVVRGYVRPEDKPEEEALQDVSTEEHADADTASDHRPVVEEEEDEPSGYSERLTAELTAHRTMALRALLGSNVEIALIALTHVLAAKTFYAGASQSCLEIAPCSSALEHVVHGIGDTPTARNISGTRELAGLPGERTTRRNHFANT
jgi:ParB family chromosome partitioning protein